MKKYLNFANLSSNYDYATGRFYSSYIDQEFDAKRFLIPTENNKAGMIARDGKDKRGVQVWIGSIISYIEAIESVASISMDQKDRLSRALYFLLSPVSGSPDGVRTFIRMAESLETIMSNLLSAPKLQHSKDKTNSYQAPANTEFLQAEFAFAQTLDARVLKQTGFDYFDLPAKEEGVLRLRQKDITETIGKQLEYVSTDLYDADVFRATFTQIPSPIADAFFSTEGDISYIAPTNFELSGKKVNLWSQDSLDHICVTGIIQNMAKSSTGKLLNVAPPPAVAKLMNDMGKGTSQARIDSLNKLYVDNAVEKGILIKSSYASAQKNANLTTSTETLGDNKFTVSPDSDVEATIPTLEPDPVDVLSVLDALQRKDTVFTKNESMIKAPKISEISFDLTKEDNFYDKNYRPTTTHKNTAEATKAVANSIKELPPHVKRLTLKRDNFYSDSGGSLESMEDTKSDAFVYNFGLIRTIEYLDRYQNGSVKNPAWKKLDATAMAGFTADTVCRIRQTTDVSINLGVFDLMNKVPVYNEYFLLRKDGANGPQKKLPAQTAYVSPNGRSYNKEPFAKGPEKDLFVKLIKYEAQQKDIKYQNEYTTTEKFLPQNRGTGTTPLEGSTPKANTLTTTPGKTSRAGSFLSKY
jgi:hypothetical protein